jgi:hypothetical protein
MGGGDAVGSALGSEEEWASEWDGTSRDDVAGEGEPGDVSALAEVEDAPAEVEDALVEVEDALVEAEDSPSDDILTGRRRGVYREC